MKDLPSLGRCPMAGDLHMWRCCARKRQQAGMPSVEAVQDQGKRKRVHTSNPVIICNYKVCGPYPRIPPSEIDSLVV